MEENDFADVGEHKRIPLQDTRNENGSAEWFQGQTIVLENRGYLDRPPGALSYIVHSMSENAVGPHVMRDAGAFDHDPVSTLLDALDVALSVMLAGPNAA